MSFSTDISTTIVCNNRQIRSQIPFISFFTSVLLLERVLDWKLAHVLHCPIIIAFFLASCVFWSCFGKLAVISEICFVFFSHEWNSETVAAHNKSNMFVTTEIMLSPEPLLEWNKKNNPTAKTPHFRSDGVLLIFGNWAEREKPSGKCCLQLSLAGHYHECKRTALWEFRPRWTWAWTMKRAGLCRTK